MSKPKILAFSGSARESSFNQKLARLVAKQVQDRGCDVTVVNLRDFPMPIMDEDLESESGIPEKAQEFYDLLKAHDGFIIACPEYNSSITPLLKNTIDWATRPRDGDLRLVAFGGKVAALVSASPGALGGLRGLTHVTSILQSIGVMVVPGQVAVGSAHEAFDDNGNLNNERTSMMLTKLCDGFVRVVSGMTSSNSETANRI